ncbi:basic phospholipase A2 Sms-N6 [Columba guinea]|nr:basic phospholipase A2 Sms-N6 [Columba guinea]
MQGCCWGVGVSMSPTDVPTRLVPISREPLGPAQDDHEGDGEKRFAALLLLRLLLRHRGQREAQGCNRQGFGCNAKMQGYSYGWHSGSPSCEGGSWCAHLSCECDRSLALCLKRSSGSYRKRYRFYLKFRCR